jgi:hypothetical protein
MPGEHDQNDAGAQQGYDALPAAGTEANDEQYLDRRDQFLTGASPGSGRR